MKNILVIDDFEDMREVILDILTEAGYTVSLAADCDSAEEECRRQPFSLILCDMLLSQELAESMLLPPGFVTVQRLAQIYPDVPIIAMSGKFDEGPFDDIQRCGACAVLSKPFGSEELLEAVQRVLGTEH